MTKLWESCRETKPPNETINVMFNTKFYLMDQIFVNENDYCPAGCKENVDQTTQDTDNYNICSLTCVTCKMTGTVLLKAVRVHAFL
jgi:hypothetical protein